VLAPLVAHFDRDTNGHPLSGTTIGGGFLAHIWGSVLQIAGEMAIW
jgi:hypothetical protein